MGSTVSVINKSTGCNEKKLDRFCGHDILIDKEAARNSYRSSVTVTLHEASVQADLVLRENHQKFPIVFQAPVYENCCTFYTAFCHSC